MSRGVFRARLMLFSAGIVVLSTSILLLIVSFKRDFNMLSKLASFRDALKKSAMLTTSDACESCAFEMYIMHCLY